MPYTSIGNIIKIDMLSEKKKCFLGNQKVKNPYV